MAAITTLPNQCHCSQICVSPANWEKTISAIKKPWRIYYRFYDPRYQKPFLVVIKGRINKIKNICQRRVLVEARIQTEWNKLLHEGYNPINAAKETPVLSTEIHPESLFIDALKAVLEKVSISRETKVDLQCVIRGVEKAATQPRLVTLSTTAAPCHNS